MKDQLITAIGALVACVAFYLLMFGSGPAERQVSRPISEEPGRHGYLALRDWLTGEAVPVLSWRARFDTLIEDDRLAGTGNVMLMTMPQQLGIRESERQQLQRWIDRGNTLLLAAALNDTPEWSSLADGASFFSDLTAVTGLEFVVAETFGESDRSMPLDDAVEPDSAVVFEPLPHPLMEGVGSLQGWSDGLSSLWTADLRELERQVLVLTLAEEARHGTPAIYEIPRNDGRILVALSTSLFGNHQIAESDTGRFVANIVRHHLGAGGSFIFDDMHQGLSSLYDPAAFFADSRLHATVAFLIAAWFLYLVGSSNRIAPVRPERARPSQATLLAGIGGFMARRLERRETGLLIFEDWFRDLRRHRGIGDESGAPWPTLAASPTLSRKLLHQLRQTYDKLERGDRIDLVELNNLILTARKAIG